MQDKHFSFFSYSLCGADIHLEMTAAAAQGGERPQGQVWSVRGDSGVAAQGEVRQKGKGDLFHPHRHFLGFGVLEQPMWLKDSGDSLGVQGVVVGSHWSRPQRAEGCRREQPLTARALLRKRCSDSTPVAEVIF